MTYDPNPFWPCGEALQRRTTEMYLNRPGYFEDQVEPQLLELTAVIMQGPEARRAIVRRICRGIAHDAVQILADKIRDELRSHVEHCDACVRGEALVCEGIITRTVDNHLKGRG